MAACAVLIVAAGACSDQGTKPEQAATGLEAQLDESTLVTTIAEGSSTTTVLPPFSSLFDEHLLDEIADLQRALDLFIHEETAVCMREQGFSYTPYVFEDLEQSPTQGAQVFGQVTEIYDAFLAGRENERGEVDPNEEVVASLSPDEQDAWVQTQAECYSDIGARNPNPLFSGNGFYGLASAETSELVAADRRYVESQLSAGACFAAESGVSTVEEGLENLNEEIALLGAEDAAGEISRDQIVNRLKELSDVEQGYLSAFALCMETHLVLEGDLFEEYLQVYFEANADRAAVWANEVRQMIDQLALYFDDIRG